MNNLADTVCRDIDTAREELVDLCGDLVAAASVNPPGRTVEVAQVVRAYLSGHDITTETPVLADAMSSSTRTWTPWKPATRQRGRCRSRACRAVMAAFMDSAWAT